MCWCCTRHSGPGQRSCRVPSPRRARCLAPSDLGLVVPGAPGLSRRQRVRAPAFGRHFASELVEAGQSAGVQTARADRRLHGATWLRLAPAAAAAVPRARSRAWACPHPTVRPARRWCRVPAHPAADRDRFPGGRSPPRRRLRPGGSAGRPGPCRCPGRPSSGRPADGLRSRATATSRSTRVRCRRSAGAVGSARESVDQRGRTWTIRPPARPTQSPIATPGPRATGAGRPDASATSHVLRSRCRTRPGPAGTAGDRGARSSHRCVDAIGPSVWGQGGRG